jgi:hypothetical protein
MLTMFKRFFLFFDLVVNYGISPATILKNKAGLQYSGIHEPTRDKEKNYM